MRGPHSIYAVTPDSNPNSNPNRKVEFQKLSDTEKGSYERIDISRSPYRQRLTTKGTIFVTTPVRVGPIWNHNHARKMAKEYLDGKP